MSRPDLQRSQLSSSVATRRELPLGQNSQVTIYQDAGRVLFGFGSLIGVDLRSCVPYRHRSNSCKYNR